MIIFWLFYSSTDKGRVTEIGQQSDRVFWKE